MKIEPIVDNFGGKDAINFYVTASDSWGNPEQSQIATYNAIGILTDENGVIKKRLTVTLTGDDYYKWDGTNVTILKMFLDKYDFLKISDEDIKQTM